MYNYFTKFQNRRNLNSALVNQKITQDFNTKHTNLAINNIINSTKQSIFKFIFDTMDADYDGNIKIFNADIKKFPKNIEKILTPIIDYLYDEKNEIDQIKFFEFMEMIYEVIILIIRTVSMMKKSFYWNSISNQTKNQARSFQ